MNSLLEAWTGWLLRAPWFLVLAPIAIAIGLLGDRRPAIRFAPAGFLERDTDGRRRGLPRSLRQRLIGLPMALQLAGLLALVVALARPATRVELPVEREGIDILLCIDVSSSMNADDLAPDRSRLAITKAAAATFVERRPDDRIGLVTFARYPDLICPPTRDHRALGELLAAIEPVDANGDEDATGIGMAVARSAVALKTGASSSRVVILWTDGEENVARPDTPAEITPLQAARLCRELGVRTYTVVAGIGRQDARGNWVELDTEDVRRLATITDGTFFEARDAGAVERVYEVIDALERARFAEPRYELADRVTGLLVLGLALLVGARLLAATWFGVLP